MNEHTSKELSARLDALGFKAEYRKSYGVYPDGSLSLRVNVRYLGESCKVIPAYTFHELWKMVPESFTYKGDEAVLDIWKGDGCDGQIDGGMCLKYRVWETSIMTSFQQHESPAEAVGLMIEYLIENKHMEIGN